MPIPGKTQTFFSPSPNRGTAPAQNGLERFPSERRRVASVLIVHVFCGLLPQLRPEVRVGHGDEVLHPLAHGALAELGHAVLGDHHVGEVPGHGDDGAGVQDGGDPGDGALLGRGDLAQHGPATLRVVGAVGIVAGPSGAGPLKVADGFRGALSGDAVCF